MDVEAILTRVEELGITLTVIRDRIQYRPASRVPPDLVEALKAHKSALLRALKDRSNPVSAFTCWVLV